MSALAALAYPWQCTFYKAGVTIERTGTAATWSIAREIPRIP